MKNSVLLASVLAIAAFAGGVVCASTWASEEIPERMLAPLPSGSERVENDQSTPKTTEGASASTPDREEIPNETTLQDRIVQLDWLVDELIASTSDTDLAEKEALILRHGLLRNLEKLKTWEQKELARFAAMEREKYKDRARGFEVTKKWVADVTQIADAGLRAKAVEEIRQALMTGDSEQQLSALNALGQLYDAEFEKAGFRSLVLPFANEDGKAQVAAMYALSALGRQTGDLKLALALIDSPSKEARAAASHLATLYSGGDITGKTGEAVLRLFDTEDMVQLTRALHGLWGAQVSPEIEKRMLELAGSENRQMRHDAIYFALSTLKEKSPAVIGKLIEVLGGSNPGNSQRALWGLGSGVAKQHGGLVVKAMKTYFAARSSGSSKGKALDLIGRYGSKNDAAWLQAIVDNPQASSQLRKAAAGALSRVEKR